MPGIRDKKKKQRYRQKELKYFNLFLKRCITKLERMEKPSQWVRRLASLDAVSNSNAIFWTPIWLSLIPILIIPICIASLCIWDCVILWVCVFTQMSSYFSIHFIHKYRNIHTRSYPSKNILPAFKGVVAALYLSPPVSKLSHHWSHWSHAYPQHQVWTTCTVRSQEGLMIQLGNEEFTLATVALFPHSWKVQLHTQHSQCPPELFKHHLIPFSQQGRQSNVPILLMNKTESQRGNKLV